MNIEKRQFNKLAPLPFHQVIEGNLLDNKKFIAIPYYAWCNRGPNKMQIWHKKEKYGM